jgi:hypothetical protein
MNRNPAIESQLPDLSKWRKLPWILIAAGGTAAAIAAIIDPTQLGYSWLVAFMFYLSLCLGSMFLVMMHHLFDAGWSVPIRRFTEHVACLSFPAMLVLFLPIAGLAGKIYPWLGQKRGDTATLAKYPLFTSWGFFGTTLICFLAWGWIARGLRYWSLRQDQTGSAESTHKMRFYSATGVFLFAITLSLAAVMWMKSLAQQWFSSAYGVWYFAASVWTTVAMVYLATAALQHTGQLKHVVKQEQYYYLGSLLLAFTVFYAYISFSQYFVIWNGNIPEETFWYAARERGGWWWISMVIIFGHFLAPFLLLLRIDWKLKFKIMVPLCLWALLMHFCDLQFQIMPVLHPAGPTLRSLLTDIAALACIGGILAEVFLRSFNRHAPYPQRDPRLAEALGICTPSTTHIAVAPERAK